MPAGSPRTIITTAIVILALAPIDKPLNEDFEDVMELLEDIGVVVAYRCL